MIQIKIVLIKDFFYVLPIDLYEDFWKDYESEYLNRDDFNRKYDKYQVYDLENEILFKS